MKKNLMTMAMAVVAILSMAVFSSCSKDDDNGSSSGSSSDSYSSEIYIVTAKSLKDIVNITATVTLDGVSKSYDVKKEGKVISNVDELFPNSYNALKDDAVAYVLPSVNFKTSGTLSIKYALYSGVTLDKEGYDHAEGYLFSTKKGGYKYGSNDEFPGKNLGKDSFEKLLENKSKLYSNIALVK